MRTSSLLLQSDSMCPYCPIGLSGGAASLFTEIRARRTGLNGAVLPPAPDHGFGISAFGRDKNLTMSEPELSLKLPGQRDDRVLNGHIVEFLLA